MCWSTPGKKGAGTVAREFFPDANTYLIFRFSRSGSRLALLGPGTAKTQVEVDESSDYIGIRFRAGQTPRLGDFTPRDLAGGGLLLEKIGSLRAGDLADRLLSLPGPVARQRVMEDALRKLPPLVREERCRKAARYLEDRGGKTRVDELARHLGLQERQLERLFQEHLGLSPKRQIRLARFWGLLFKLRQGSFASQADLAYQCGYADQSHMIREFRELAGRPPGEKGAWQARRKPEGVSGVLGRLRR
jgi:AraC-like DNA-binding protein